MKKNGSQSDILTKTMQNRVCKTTEELHVKNFLKSERSSTLTELENQFSQTGKKKKMAREGKQKANGKTT